MVIAGLLIGLLVGAGAAWLYARAQHGAESAALLSRAAALEAELGYEQARSSEKAALLEKTERELSSRFDALAADALRKNNESFLELASAKLGQKEQAVEHLVTPLKELLQKYDGKQQEIEVAREGAYSSLTEQVRQMMETQTALRSETGNLVSALRDRPNVRGRWGEIQLRNVVEMAGMLEHCDFETQHHVATDDGHIRPDLVVKMPGGGSVVIDAKVPAQAFMEALDCKDEALRTLKLRDHARQVRDHVTKLGAKNYWAQFERTPHFVILFLPSEPFLSAALEQDSSLLEDSFKNNRVLIATPMTLIGVLSGVALNWRQEMVAESAKEVSELGRELYKRLATLTEHVAKVGDRLQSTVRAYNDSVGSFERSVLPGARKLKDHGITSTSDLAELRDIELAVRTVKTPELPAGVPNAEAEADAA
jgi:DNA recombination protein RmuC